MELKELRKLAGLNEELDEKELASDITKLLGLFRIKAKLQRGSEAYLDGWNDAEKAFNKIAAKEFKGVKKFRG